MWKTWAKNRAKFSIKNHNNRHYHIHVYIVVCKPKLEIRIPKYEMTLIEHLVWLGHLNLPELVRDRYMTMSATVTSPLAHSSKDISSSSSGRDSLLGTVWFQGNDWTRSFQLRGQNSEMGPQILVSVWRFSDLWSMTSLSFSLLF